MYQNSPSIKGQWIQSKSEHLTKHSWPSNNNYIHYVLKSKFDYCDSFLAFCASTKPPFDSSSTTRLLWIWRLAQAICSKNSSRFQKEFPSEFLKKKALKLFRNPSKILPSAPLRKFWIGKLKNTKYQCHQCPLYESVCCISSLILFNISGQNFVWESDGREIIQVLQPKSRSRNQKFDHSFEEVFKVHIWIKVSN